MKLNPQSQYAQKRISKTEVLAVLNSAGRNHGLSAMRTPKARAVEEFVTVYPELLDMLKTASMLADYTYPTLVLGETGTGKELIARILHGNRNKHSFYAVNCSGIPEQLFESILFGHKKGSFTGAYADEIGLLRSASGGTAFLDEVGDLPIAQQTKLLRVLQTNRVQPVGDVIEWPINCKFVFATNKDIKGMIPLKFREDLYYRISTFVLRTVPLRERPLDIEPIVRRIYQREQLSMTEVSGVPVVETPPLAAYDQGNVRALYNYILRREILGMDTDKALLDL